jgi:acyl carrier protein
MTRDQHRAQLLAFLDTIRRPGKRVDQLGDRDPLVTSGLIDSLAVLELIIYLETRVGLDFSQTGVQPENLRTVSAILDLIDRHGR